MLLWRSAKTAGKATSHFASEGGWTGSQQSGTTCGHGITKQLAWYVAVAERDGGRKEKLEVMG